MAKKASSKENQQTSLVIVESPAKVRTISRFLGDGFVVEASIGHCCIIKKVGVESCFSFSVTT